VAQRPAEMLAKRAAADGTAGRPLLSQGAEGGEEDEEKRALERISQLLEERRKQYQTSDIVVSLEGDEELGAPAAVVAHRVLAAITDRVRRDTAAREDRRKFEVVNENLPPTMRVVKSINQAGEEDSFLP
jgi:hypothetical protein